MLALDWFQPRSPTNDNMLALHSLLETGHLPSAAPFQGPLFGALEDDELCAFLQDLINPHTQTNCTAPTSVTAVKVIFDLNHDRQTISRSQPFLGRLLEIYAEGHLPLDLDDSLF